MRAAEGSKISLANHPFRRSVHRLQIQSGCYARMIDIEERILARGDAIAISPRRSVKPRVRFVRHATQTGDSDRSGQQIIESSHEIRRKGFLYIEMRHHLLCMHACVRPPGKNERHRRPEDGSKSRFHLCLNRVSVRLRLRTVIAGAVICKGNEITHSDLQFIHLQFTIYCAIGLLGH